MINSIKKFNWIIIAIILAAAFLRFFLLDLRPPHHDEGIFGWFADLIEKNGYYEYDPQNYHGPITYYLLYFFQNVFGHNIWALRSLSILFDLLLIYWIFLFGRFFGQTACIVAAIAITLSPAHTYFSRGVTIDIHMAFFSILILWGVIGLYSEGTKKYLWAIVAGITGAILTKETYTITIFCFIVSWITLLFVEQVSPSPKIKKANQEWNKNDLIVLICGSIFIIILFYSGIFQKIDGIWGIFETLINWLTAANSGVGHSKPFSYWFLLFLRYEHAALVGLILAFFVIYKSPRFIRFTAVYGLYMFLVYSIITYKTPWLIVNFLWPFYFVLGYFISNLIENKAKSSAFIFIGILFTTSSIISYRLNYKNYENHKEPYVYVQTLNEVKKLTEPILKLVEMDHTKYNIAGNILRTDEWPLPWVFHDFKNVGYYASRFKPYRYDADFLFVESKRINEVEANLTDSYFTDIIQMRDSQDNTKIYFNCNTFMDLSGWTKQDFSD